MQTDSLRTTEAFYEKMSRLKRHSSIQELNITHPVFRSCKRNQYEKEIEFLRSDVAQRRWQAIHVTNETIAKLQTLLTHASKPIDECVAYPSEEFDECYWDVQLYEFMSYNFTRTAEQFGPLYSPKMIVRRTLQHLSNESTSLYEEAAAYISYVNRHLDVECSIHPFDLIGATKEFIRLEFSHAMGIDDENLSL